MPRINYRLIKGRAVWSEISADRADALTLRFSPRVNGYINHDNTVYRVKSGDAVIPLTELSDSTHSLRLQTDGESFALESFSKSGGEIVPLPTEDEIIRVLLERCCKNEERIKLLEDRVSALLKASEGHRIFN